MPFARTAWPDNVAVFLRWNPMLLLWSVVLGVPIVVVTVRFVVGRSGSDGAEYQSGDRCATCPAAPTTGRGFVRPCRALVLPDGHAAGDQRLLVSGPGGRAGKSSTAGKHVGAGRPGRRMTPSTALRPPFPSARPRNCNAALASAAPGTVIAMADGIYDGEFTATAGGTPRRPSGSAAEAGGSSRAWDRPRRCPELQQVRQWRLVGFHRPGRSEGGAGRRSHGQHHAGPHGHRDRHEGVHLRSGSSGNVLRGLVSRPPACARRSSVKGSM